MEGSKSGGSSRQECFLRLLGFELTQQHIDLIYLILCDTPLEWTILCSFPYRQETEKQRLVNLSKACSLPYSGHEDLHLSLKLWCCFSAMSLIAQCFPYLLPLYWMEVTVPMRQVGIDKMHNANRDKRSSPYEQICADEKTTARTRGHIQIPTNSGSQGQKITLSQTQKFQKLSATLAISKKSVPFHRKLCSLRQVCFKLSPGN